MEKRHKRILLAVVGAVVSTWLIYNTITPKADKAVEYVDVIEVSQAIEKNQEITSAALTVKQIPKTEYQSWMLKDKEKAVGKYASMPLFVGDKLRAERFVEKKAVEFGPNERMMNMDLLLVDYGGLPEEGQYADILAYIPPVQKGIGVGTTELVLQNVYIQKLITKEGEEVDNELKTTEKTEEKEVEEEVPMVPAIVTIKTTVEDSIVLNTFLKNPDISLRMIGRTEGSKDVNIVSPTSEKLRKEIRFSEAKPEVKSDSTSN